MSGPDFTARLERAAESGDPEAVDIVVREANAVQYALDVHEELARERADHERTRKALARAYDVIAKMRGVLGMGAQS